MACASIDSVVYGRQTINIGFKVHNPVETKVPYEQIQEALQATILRLLRPRDASELPPRGTLEIRVSGAFPGTSTGSVAVTT